MRSTRRLFLRDSALLMAGVGTVPAWLARAAGLLTEDANDKVLVVVFQRGAADGLNLVVPFAEQSYYDLRPTIAVAQPGRENGALDLDGRFGLHPSLAALKPLYEEKQLAIVHAAGSPNGTRSHFDAQDYMESGTPGRKSTPDGWLNRALGPGGDDESPVRAVAMGKRLPRTLRGDHPAVVVDSLPEFRVYGAAQSSMFQSMYAESRDAELNGTARETFEAIRLLGSIRRSPYNPAAGAKYPHGRLGPNLRELARLIKADVGVRVAFADMGGWDHHTNETQQLTPMLRHFGDSLAVFHRDLGDRAEDVIVVTMSEFGRTAAENGNRGTDHGHGNVMFVLGGGIAGGRVYGSWPGLARERLYEGRDLAVTTDFRTVLAELAAFQLGASKNQALFPGFKSAKSLGLTS